MFVYVWFVCLSLKIRTKENLVLCHDTAQEDAFFTLFTSAIQVYWCWPCWKQAITQAVTYSSSSVFHVEFISVPVRHQPYRMLYLLLLDSMQEQSVEKHWVWDRREFYLQSAWRILLKRGFRNPLKSMGVRHLILLSPLKITRSKQYFV